MKVIRNTLNFLGSLPFAIMLIATTALFVSVGTFIESFTQSHRYAAMFTYSNPFFLSLLAGFFINILLSALHRWPFKTHHIPFLITHLGLLMVIAGVIIKTLYGVQGNMGILEGSGTEEIFVPGSYVVQVEKYTPSGIQQYEYRLTKDLLGNNVLKSKNPIDDLTIAIVEYAPHSEQHFETWIKNDHVYIKGFPAIPLNRRVTLPSISAQEPWTLLGTKSLRPFEVAEQNYVENVEVIFKKLDQQIAKIRLKDILDKESTVDQLQIRTHLDFEKSLLTFTFPNNVVKVSLEGENALLNQHLYPYMGQYPLSIELKGKPTLLVINDYHHQDYLFLFDLFGRVQKHIYNNDKLDLLNIYYKGFGGYTAQIEIPKNPLNLKETKKKQLAILKQQINETLNETLKESSQLSPPLQLIADATQMTHQKLGDVLVDYLYEWNESYAWLFPEDTMLSDSYRSTIKAIDWSKIDNSIHKSLELASTFFLELENRLHLPLEKVLSGAPWKQHYSEIQLNDVENNLMSLTQQIFQVVDQVPDKKVNSSSARKLSAYMRLYGLHYSKIVPKLPIADEGVTIEAPLSQKIIQQESLVKLEDNKPKLTLKMSKGKSTQYISLQYDAFATGLKWPVLGDYVVRFQPQVLVIPYHVRLRDARQITYPDSTQPLSFESDLLITDLRTGKEEETTIKMNKVYETWDGYRFYMANLTPGVPTEAQKVQLVVNLDPVKYYLTYPGAIILTLGIVLLFWLQPYKKK